MLTIAYDGTCYHGWQRQENALSVQQVVEEACEKLFGCHIKIIGAGRTDAKVHALGQVATLQVATSIPIERIPYALNTYLPEDIVIQQAKEQPMEFHPRYDAINKTYRYQILNAPFAIPQWRNYTTFVSYPLNVDRMSQAGKYFCGTHDFVGFCSTGSHVITTIRTIFDFQVTFQDRIITLEVKGNGFLYNMVRIIAGTLIEVGKGKINPFDIPSIIQSKDRKKAGPTAPPQGLTLIKIEYGKTLTH
ncbi:MAG: tRNA pseudouridine(38-40) synthase TruA [Epulopiscium sp.]|nr:tRNA pseudouridine(38-40) synthase TruA [Candidatus Epulonipiscium sp.]